MEKIKSLKLKVTAQYQDEQVRVSGKNRDDLQKVIAELKAMDFEIPLAIRELPLMPSVSFRQPRLREESRRHRGDDRASLGAAGWQLVADARRADTVVINTCAFIDPAKAESTETILEHAAAQTTRPAAGGRRMLGAALRRPAASADSRDRRRRRHRRVRKHRRTARRRGRGQAPRASRFRSRTRTRFSSAADHDAASDRVSEDRRGLRSSVHVLHHSEAARRVSQPQRRIDSQGSARACPRRAPKN